MDTYINFKSEKIKLGVNSRINLKEEVLCDIVESISRENGGAAICLEKLTDDAFQYLTKDFENPVPYGDESYIVEIDDNVTIYYTGEITKIFALYAIKRHYEKDGISKGIIYNTPKVPFRCFRSYLPGKKTLQSFKKFIDMLLAFGHNTIMLEIGGAMEYKRHPEINEGWLEYNQIFKEYNGKSREVQRISQYPKNCIHPDNGEGEYLTYEELDELVRYCRERHMEIVPEVPSLSHADYLLYNHPELSEIEGDILPNNACPSNEDYYKLIFDVLDEIIEVFQPKRINICHDEVYVYGQCPKCKGKDPAQLIGGHILRLYNHLAEQGVKTMIWGDGILPILHCGAPSMHRRLPWDGKTTVHIQGKDYPVRRFKFLSMEEWAKEKEEELDAEAWFVPEKYKCIDVLPKDLEVMNWSWALDAGTDPWLIEHGLYNVFGNFFAYGMKGFDERIRKGVSGVSFSNWGRTDFEAQQRTNSLIGLAYNSLACWSVDYDESKKEENVFMVADAIYKYLNYDVLRQKHLEITHTTDAFIEHPFLHSGFTIVREDYRIGDYEITYTDGSKESLPVYWGYNIGNWDIAWGDNEASRTLSPGAGGYCTNYIFEPIGKSKPIKDGTQTWYKISIPVSKEVEKVTVKPAEGYNIWMKEAVVAED